MPVGLCTPSLYVKKTCQPNHSALSFAIFIDDPRLKNGNEMPHAAQQIRRTRVMAPRPTRPDMHLAAMRMSRLHKSFGWRTSMAAVVDATLLPPYLRLISDKHIHFHSSTLTLSILHLGEPRFTIWIVDFGFTRSRARFMGPAAPIRYTLMGLRRCFFLFHEHMYLLLAHVR
jgi:hypothetical protein